jgi:hypothetical protein
MRRDVLLLHHPGEDLRRSVRAIGAEPLWLQSKAGFRTVEHGSGRAHLGASADTGRLDIDDDRCLKVDEIIISVSEEGVPLVSTRPLRRRVRWRDELRNYLTGSTPGGVIQSAEIFPRRASRRRQLPPIDLIRARERALFVSVRRDQAGVDGKAFITNKPLGYRSLHHHLEQMTECVAIAEATMTGFGEGRVVRNITVQAKAAEPAIGQVQIDLFAQPPFGANAEAVPDDQHADQ